MVERDRRNDGQLGLDDVGGIQASAQADLDDALVDRGLRGNRKTPPR